MHPAYSVIFFTTASGAGFGLLALLGVLGPLHLLPAERWFGLAGLAVALGLAASGLASSTFHLQSPRRAVYAFSQWRSSWLSREGVIAVATMAAAAVFAFAWVILEQPGGWWGAAGLLAALGAVATVLSTGMIYAVLKPIRQWRDPLVVPLYLLFALATGAAWLNAVLGTLVGSSATASLGAIVALALAWAAKLAYWRRIDRGRSPSTPESATGLGGLGPVRLLMSPHTEENYLLREMGFRVARKHAVKLRAIAVLLGFGLAVALIVAGWLLSAMAGAFCAILAALSATVGTLVERWLFFAEARHTVTLYYGGRDG
jgi:DMSO reductase anchor subunit